MADSGSPKAKKAKLGDADSPERCVEIPTSEFFRQVLTRELSSSHFGEHKHALPKDSKSAGARELEKTGAKEFLLKTTFLRRIYHLLTECARLMKEQAKVRDESASLGISIKQYRDAQKKLQSLQNDIAKLTHRIERSNLLSPHKLKHLFVAMEELQAAEDALGNTEQATASKIHPDLRLKHDRSAKERYEFRWQSLLSPYDYELDSLHKKAPEYWLMNTLDSEIKRSFRHKHVKLTAATRNKIISAILKSSGFDPISPARIKEYFATMAREKKAAN